MRMNGLKDNMKYNIYKRRIVILSLTVCLMFLSCQKQDVNLQWPIVNQGQEICGRKGIKGIDIGLIDDKPIELDDSNNIVCVVDSKIDTNNELFEGIWKNDINELSEFTGKSHGASVVGIICSNAPNGEYISVLKNVKIYYIEIDNVELDINKLIRELECAERLGARVVNCSFVMDEYNEQLYEYISNSEMLYVCAAGNSNENVIMYPAAYDLDNVISVGGTDNNGFCGAHSNYSENIDIAAPGEDVLCITNGEEKYELLSGSSIATAYVTSACAYICNKTGCTAVEAKDILLENSVVLSSLEGKVQDNRFLSFEKISNAINYE